jgi:hypothetical protein
MSYREFRNINDLFIFMEEQKKRWRIKLVSLIVLGSLIIYFLVRSFI